MGGLIDEVGPEPLAVLLGNGVGLDCINPDMGEGEKANWEETAAEGHRSRGKDNDTVQQKYVGFAFGGDHRVGLKHEIRH